MADIVEYAENNAGQLSETFCEAVNFSDLPVNVQHILQDLQEANMIPPPDIAYTDVSGNEYSTIQDQQGTDWTIQGPATGGKCLFTPVIGRG